MIYHKLCKENYSGIYDLIQHKITSMDEQLEYDFASSSLIQSPLVSALLRSHGILGNTNCLDHENCSTDVVRISAVNPIGDSPTFLHVFSMTTPERWHDSLQKDSITYECGWSACHNSFTCRKDLAQHVNNRHVCQDNSLLYRCHWQGCSRQGKIFKAKYQMLAHVRIHTLEKPHSCDICGKDFSRLENLKIHTRSHTGEKPYVCPMEGCNKAYSNTSDRFKHTRTHFVDKPYACKKEGCSKRYTDPSSLRKHMKISGHNKEGQMNDSLQVEFKR